ncbi:ETC complex I subunit [bacterium]|nr:ETC complex I subunit [bacterium]
MLAKIYRPAPTAMQSGRANTREWVLEYDVDPARRTDPLMGWTSSSETLTQVRLTFPTREQAIDYAKRAGLTFRVIDPREPKRVIKSYAENFSSNRKRPWTH